MVYDHPKFPAALKAEMYDWVREHASEEKKAADTDEQFLYKARKKAIGPFKAELWNLPADVRAAIGASLEEQFAFLMSTLKVKGTAATAVKHLGQTGPLLSLEASRKAAAGTITLEERKAEGLSD